jgi:hypothetical protein
MPTATHAARLVAKIVEWNQVVIVQSSLEVCKCYGLIMLILAEWFRITSFICCSGS